MTYTDLVEFSITIIHKLAQFSSNFVEWLQTDVPKVISSLLGFDATWIELFFGASLVLVIGFGLIKFFTNIL